MFSSLGLSGSGGLMVGIIAVFAVLPTVFLQWARKGMREKWRGNELGTLNTITR